MTATEFTPLLSTLGGVCIGLAMAAVLGGLGKIAGISGIAYGAMTQSDRAELTWRICFLAGMGMTGLIAAQWMPSYFAVEVSRSVVALLIAGVLVGVGTRIGDGCTSGHGIAGIARLSRRSLVATASFVAAGMVTATIVRIAFGGAL